MKLIKLNMKLILITILLVLLSSGCASLLVLGVIKCKQDKAKTEEVEKAEDNEL